jgi:hypothetical protein
VKPGKNRPPDFEIEVAAQAREITFRVVGDVGWRTEGVARVDRVRRRDGLPSPVRPHVRYRNVHVSTSLKAWLDGDQTHASVDVPPSSSGIVPVPDADPGDPQHRGRPPGPVVYQHEAQGTDKPMRTSKTSSARPTRARPKPSPLRANATKDQQQLSRGWSTDAPDRL